MSTISSFLTFCLEDEEYSSRSRMTYGSVVVDTQSRVLLREPRDHFDGYVWTFSKGRSTPGETPEQTALRETREETGYPTRILVPIPGVFAGGTSDTRYFLATPTGTARPFDQETASVRWVSFSDASALIRLTTNPLGRKRDLTVLAAAEQTLHNSSPFSK